MSTISLKKAVRVIISLSILMLLTTGLHAQSKLMITDVRIAQDNGNYQTYSNKSANMASDVPITVLLYRDNNISYYACFHYTQRGKKLKLTVQDHVVYGDEKIKTDKQVVRQRMDDDLDTERMIGYTEEEIVYNEDLGSKLRVIYRFELHY
ncbi:MAG: hypothetical protein P8X57_09440 [Cyclobacteriaceae bacterium]